MSETIGYILISIGVVFDVLGCIGLVRLPDVYNRLQAATKCVTLGTCMILIGAAVIGFGSGANALAKTLADTQISKGAAMAVGTMQENGATCILISGGFTIFTQDIAQKLGFAGHHGNILGIKLE